MTLFEKLNYKNADKILVMNAPDSFEEVLGTLDCEKLRTPSVPINFAMVFVLNLDQIENSIAQIHPLLEGDAILWYCYPKGTSKKYKCEFNRDNGWKAVGVLGWETVRMVAIDEDWSALRFRKLQYVKTITRTDKNKANK